MGFHRNQVLDDIHVVNARVYADIAARDADVPFQVAENINKVIRVDTPVSFFVLTSVGPTVFQELTTTLSDTFLELLDTPSSYVGKAKQVVQVGGAEGGLEFGLRIDQIDEFIELTDTPPSYVGKSLQVVQVAAAEDGLEFGLRLDEIDEFIELTDTPPDYTGKALQVVQVTAAEDGLEFGLRIDQIDEFIELTDTPSAYVGKALQVLRANAGETKLEFSTAGMGDVSGAGASTDQAMVRFDGTTGRIIQDSVIIVSDLGVMDGITKIDTPDGAVFKVEGENNAQLLLEAHNLTVSNWTQRSEFSAIPDAPQFVHDHGDGAGNVTESQHILLNDLGMQVLDTINLKGLLYAADYSANFVDLSLIDKAYSDSRGLAPGVLFVRTLADLPTEISGTITIPVGTVVFLETTVDIGGLRLLLGSNCALIGYSAGQSRLTSTTGTETLVAIDLSASAQEGIVISDVTIENTGAGAAFLYLGPDATLLVNRTTVLGDFIIGQFASVSTLCSHITGEIRFVDNPTGNFNLRESRVTVASGGIGINIDDAVSNMGSFEMEDSVFDLVSATSRGIVILNPDSVNVGSLEFIDLEGVGTEVLAVNPGLGTGIELGFEPAGMTVFEGNLYTVDDTLNRINKHVGLTSAIASFIASPGSFPKDIVFVQGNLVSSNSSPFLVDIHAGFSTTITSSFTLSEAPMGLTFNGVNLIVQAKLSGDILVMDGLSGTVLQTLSGPSFETGQGLHFDGVNLWVAGPANKIQIRQGVSDVVQYTIDLLQITGGVSSLASGMAQTTPGGPFIFGDSIADEVFITDNPITFDQSSPTWKMHRVATVLDSADSGCVCVRVIEGSIVTISSVDVWADLGNSGETIVYTILAGAEKFIMNDSANGEMTYIGTVSKFFRMSGLLLAEGTGGTDSIEIGVSVNNGDPTLQAPCTMANGIVTVTQRSTLTSPGAAVRLAPGDKIKLQVRNRTDSNNITIFQVLLSATG